MLIGTVSTAFSQAEESSNRFIVIEGDTLYTLTKAELRNVAKVVIKHERDSVLLDIANHRIENLMMQSIIQNNINTTLENEVDILGNLLLLTKGELETTRNGIKEAIKEEKKKSFKNGALVGAGTMVVLVAGLAVLFGG